MELFHDLKWWKQTRPSYQFLIAWRLEIFIDFKWLTQIHILLKTAFFWWEDFDCLALKRKNSISYIFEILLIISCNLSFIFVSTCSTGNLLDIMRLEIFHFSIRPFHEGLENDTVNTKIHSHPNCISGNHVFNLVLSVVEHVGLYDFRLWRHLSVHDGTVVVVWYLISFGITVLYLVDLFF